jgi:hypothetical protein
VKSFGRNVGATFSANKLCIYILIEVNAKCRHLIKLTCKGTLRQVFIKVYRLEIVNFLRTFSHVGIPTPALWSVLPPVAPLPFSLVQLFPLPPLLVWISILYARIQCVRGVGYGFLGRRQINTCHKALYSQFLWRYFAFCIAFEESYLYTCGIPSSER